MNDKLDKILDLLRSQNEMIKDIHDYVKEVTSEKYIGIRYYHDDRGRFRKRRAVLRLR